MENQDFKLLCEFLNSNINNQIDILDIRETSMQSPAQIFSQYYRVGAELKQNNNLQCFLRYLQSLNNNLKSNDWIAKIAICHGLFSDNDDTKTIDEKFGLLKELL